ncbi:MAG TPA: carboxylating nicotinate-nucleotide diphosphorylase [Armatimonadetes bacterium]|nr:carboxylating nicotinate-nucleotide diphosphorylase [Armatimonadota bacterium]
MQLERRLVQPIIDTALREDIGWGDVTTQVLIDELLKGTSAIIARERGCVAGLPIAQWVFETIEPDVHFEAVAHDGDWVDENSTIAYVSGKVQALLMGERVALNFLQRLSGIATLTAEFVKRVAPFNVLIADTRKTTPGLRLLEKYAVRVGGGANHRFALCDAVLIKDNHIKAVGNIADAIKRARMHIPHTMKIEVEVRTLDEVHEALNAGADIIMLDNMDLEMLREAVNIIGERALVEASGGVTLENVKSIAATGVNVISIGRITHSAPALDISMELVDVGNL